MKFKFSLQKVLQHRKVLQDLAQRDFEEIQSESFKQKELLMDMITSLHEARNEAGQVQSRPANNVPERLKQIHEYTILQDVRILRQKAKVEEIEKLVEEKREILRQKAIDSKMIEKLKERKREQFNHEVRVEEQKEADELSLLRFDAKDGE